MKGELHLPSFEEAMRLAAFLQGEALMRHASAEALRAMAAVGAPVATDAMARLDRQERALRYAAGLVEWLAHRAGRLDELQVPAPVRRANSHR